MAYYSFEEPYAKTAGLKEKALTSSEERRAFRNTHDKRALLLKLDVIQSEEEFDTLKLSDQETEALNRFVNGNIANIQWYQNRIAKENRLRIIYASITVFFLLAVPALTLILTLKAKDLGFGNAEMITSVLTVLLTSILGIHKLISSWMEKRKYRSLFFQAKTKLQGILFGLSDQFDRFETIDFAMNKEKHINEEIYLALKKGTKESRIIIDAETQEFFNMSATTTFDLGSVLTSSMQTAKSLISGFKPHSFDLDKMQEVEIKEKEERKKAAIQERENETSLKATMMKIERQTNKQLVVFQSLERLRESDNDSDIAERIRLKTELDSIEDTIEELELEFMRLQAELRPIEDDDED